jgi:hypothetical protein
MFEYAFSLNITFTHLLYNFISALIPPSTGYPNLSPLALYINKGFTRGTPLAYNTIYSVACRLSYPLRAVLTQIVLDPLISYILQLRNL